MPTLIWKFLKGCVTIKLEGLYLERFLNQIKGKYRIKSVKRPLHTEMHLTVPASKAAKIFAEAEKRSIKAYVIGTDKSVHIADMLYRRWWIPAATAAVIAAAIWLSGFCFQISFTGNETTSEFVLAELLEQNGVIKGMRKRQIDLLAVKNLLYAEYPSFAFVEPRFIGTTLEIILQEGNAPPEILTYEPCSVAAEKRGVILSVTVGEGMAAVEPGDIVEAGDVIIRGAYIKKEMPFLVHARGTVDAQVDYIGSASLSMREGLVRTGNYARVRYLCIGGMKMRLKGNNPYELFEEESVTEYTIPENMPAFLRIVQTTYYECEKGVNDQMRRKAETQLREQAYYQALAQLPKDAEMLDFYSVITEREGKLTAVATITVKEDIGKNIPADLSDIEITAETGDT